MGQTLISLINNAALLLALSIIYQFTNQRIKKNNHVKQIVNGVLIALTCITIMAIPFKISQEILFDTRTILISVTALLFGSIPTIITVVTAIIFRIIQGGMGTWPGVVGILSSAIIGTIWRLWIYPKKERLRWISVYIMSFLVHIAILLCMFLLPYPESIETIKKIILPVLLLYPVVSVLLYALLTQQEDFYRMQDQLKKSEERFQLLYNKAPLGYQSLDINGKIISVNGQWLDTFNFSEKEVIGKKFIDLIHPKYQEEFLSKLSQIEKLGIIHSELKMETKNGESLYIALDGKVVHELESDSKQILCILKDITSEKKVGLELKLSEKKYRQLFETMAQGVLYQASDGRIISANPAAERILGLTIDQMRGMTSLDPEWKTIKEDGTELSGWDHPSMITLRTGKPFGPYVLGIYQPKINDNIWISINAIPIFENGESKPSMAYTTFQDITEERKANQRYQLLFNQMVDAFALHEIICNEKGKPIDYKFLAVNPAFEKMTGLNAKDIVGKTVLEVLPQTETFWIETYGKVALTGETVNFKSYASTTNKHFRVMAYQPAPGQFVCTFSDDTTQVRAEEALKESEKKYSSYIENAPYAVFVVNEKGNYVEVNNAASKITGYSMEELLNMTISEITPVEYKNEAINGYKLIQEKGFASLELKYIHKNGSIRWWEIDVVKLSDTRFLGFAIDTTSKKQAEEELKFQSMRDYLTGLYNRRYYEVALKRLDKESELPLSVITGDINGLKLVNDAFGHAEGDKLIVECARIIASCIEPSYILARTGGDEFGLIMPRTNSAKAYEVMKNIQNVLKKFDADNNTKLHKHSVSLGFATKEKKSEEMRYILKNAEDHMYQRKMLETNSVHSAIVASIKATLFEKNNQTEEHAERLIALSKGIGLKLGLSQAELDKLELLAQLHDIGKVGIRDYLLTKPGKLTESEWVEMKRHPEIGYRIAITTPELVPVAEGILCHHEWWNGGGYPKGLKGEDIPLISRIISVVDAYDAMVNDRPYRKAIEKDEALKIIKKNAGIQFDPKIAQIFIEIMSKK